MSLSDDKYRPGEGRYQPDFKKSTHSRDGSTGYYRARGEARESGASGTRQYGEQVQTAAGRHPGHSGREQLCPIVATTVEFTMWSPSPKPAGFFLILFNLEICFFLGGVGKE